MGHCLPMKLAQWLSEHETRARAFARLVGVAPSTVSRWLAGEIIPDRERMRKIADATDGRVMPNDFMDFPAGGPGSAPSAFAVRSSEGNGST